MLRKIRQDVLVCNSCGQAHTDNFINAKACTGCDCGGRLYFLTTGDPPKIAPSEFVYLMNIKEATK